MAEARYRRVVWIAFLSLAAIILTGAAVRLTQSGLGCADWPTCSEDRVVPEASFHGWIEFGNRLFSAAPAAATIAAVIRARKLSPPRPDLVKWAWGLVVGVMVQILVGAVTVFTDLNPLSVTTHFLLSMVLLWNALVLLHRIDRPQNGPRYPATRNRPLAVLDRWGHLAAASLMLLTGTIVTGTGPNSGDARADRLRFSLDDVARIHSLTVWAFLAGTILLVVRLRGSDNQRAFRAGRWLLVSIIAQGALGYVQYDRGVPPVLVGLHVLGAVIVWSVTVWFHLKRVEPNEISAPDDLLATDAGSLLT